MSIRRGHELVCPYTLPVNRKFTFRSVSDETIVVKRGDIEKIPISIPDKIAGRMEHIAQLGLKNSYLKLDPGQHVRWAHACGTYTIGSLWLTALYQGERLPSHLRRLPYPVFEAAQIITGYALLLHDYGHLFFSHLLEDALKDINWIPADHGIASLEYTVLRNRLYNEGDSELVDSISQSIRTTEAANLYREPLDIVASLMNGKSGLTWLQAIVNSPIDADKIDYIRRDQDVLTESAYYPIRTRLNFGPSGERWPWFEEFISDQYVNQAGFLCLPGRSALAAGDLWRERLFLYERFYLSPAVRAADRMALELIQQFLIRCVMSDGFAQLLRDNEFLDECKKEEIAKPAQLLNALQGLRGLSEAVYNGKAKTFDIVSVKYEIATHLLSDLSDLLGNTSKRDWECLQLMALALRQKKLLIDERYAELLTEAWKRLEELKEGKTELSTFGRDYIIGNIQFKRREEKAVREVFRAFQHEHSGDLLVDISLVPHPLSVPFCNSVRSLNEERFARILVPKGPIERWTSASHELQPLTLATTKSLEHPFGTVLLLSPKPLSRSRKLYLWDRALAVAERHALALEVHSDA